MSFWWKNAGKSPLVIDRILLPALYSSRWSKRASEEQKKLKYGYLKDDQAGFIKQFPFTATPIPGVL